MSPTTGSAASRGGFRVRVRVRGLFYFFMVSKNVRNHELGGSLTTGSAALRGGFRVRVRGLFINHLSALSPGINEVLLGWHT